jgi:hypothetical protein
MKKLLVALAAAFGLLLTSGTASAVGYANPVNVPSHNSKPLQRFFLKQPLPAFQAAPWYLYFPYNDHFQMAAPPPGADFGPGGPGAYPGGYSNPYFPSQYGPRVR